MMDKRKSISGGSEDSRKQMQAEVRAMPKEERQKLLSEAGGGVEINATQALAIKADLDIPWYRIRVLRRCVSSRRVSNIGYLLFFRWLKSEYFHGIRAQAAATGTGAHRRGHRSNSSLSLWSNISTIFCSRSSTHTKAALCLLHHSYHM